MVKVYLLTFPHFLLRKKEHKSYFGKNRTHDLRTSRCAGCLLLDHSGDELNEEPIKCHEEVVSLQPMIPPNILTLFPPRLRDAQKGLDAFNFFLKHHAAFV